MKIYFAGPDVFYPGYETLVQTINALGSQYGFEPLCPGVGGLTTPESIFARNLQLIEKADGLIANLNPFRGQEPDSGTVFEVGYARALGKWVIGYLTDRRDLLAKLEPDPHQLLPDGSMVEDFGFPLNLMLALGVERLASSLTEAINLARQKI
ncbi:MAG: nucleoside 2-deoxyribosyltransferase [Deltaproteobacteria bacterium]|jgi:nucleoside 2-deoxyribosyltransferase|nr:nucleoside 2-deoxyribosyltransferase [Deltaproteobacteria bacterium]